MLKTTLIFHVSDWRARHGTVRTEQKLYVEIYMKNKYQASRCSLRAGRRSFF